MFPAVILGDPPHREQTSLPGLGQQMLEVVSCSAITALRGAVHAFLEAEDMPLDLCPWEVVPGHHQGLAILCCGS